MRVIRSPHDHAETVRRVTEAVQRRGMSVFAVIDHAAAARAVGLELPDEQVILFGNPKAGTGLMQLDPRIGIELPLRLLIWGAADGACLGYNDPRELAERYDVQPQAAMLESMSNLLAEVATEAAGELIN